MNFRYRSHQIHDIVKAKKVVREGQSLEFKPYKEHSLTLSLDLDLADGGLLNLQLRVNAGQADAQETYRAVTFSSTVAVQGATDIDASGTVGFANTVTTTGSGTVTITNTGTMTIAAIADMTLSGAFTQDGPAGSALLATSQPAMTTSASAER